MRSKAIEEFVFLSLAITLIALAAIFIPRWTKDDTDKDPRRPSVVAVRDAVFRTRGVDERVRAYHQDDGSGKKRTYLFSTYEFVTPMHRFCTVLMDGDIPLGIDCGEPPSEEGIPGQGQPE